MNRFRAGLAAAIALCIVAALAYVWITLGVAGLVGILVAVVKIVDPGYFAAGLRLTVPIAFAALGGIFAEKAGVINIGIEGLLIISAFSGIAVTSTLAGSGGLASLVGVIVIAVTLNLLVVTVYLLDVIDTSLLGLLGLLVAGPVAVIGFIFVLEVLFAVDPVVWLGFFGAVLSSTYLALVFAVITVRYRADQIIAGLAVWLIALGLAPFASRVIWGTVNSPSVPTLQNWTIPVLSAIPFVGSVLFDANPTVYMLLLATPAAWYVMNRTTFGRWVEASGENPKALDTAGVDVDRVRYAAVLLSGVLSGIGGAGLALGQVGQFIGSGQTMVGGRGFIGITAYLFGNYNPLGAFAAAFLFAALDALQIRVQQIPTLDLPPSLVQTVPFVTVILVLALVGRTRIPEAAGEYYESGEE